MDDKERRQRTWMWCFWITVAVVCGVFIIPVETRDNGTVSVSYTLYDKLTGQAPKTGTIRLPH